MATRGRGAEIRQAIAAAMPSIPTGEAMILDFSGVEIVSFSIGDEVVARVLLDMAAGAFEERPILVANANEDVLDPIVRALQRREVLGAQLDGDRIVLLNAPDHLQATFDAARERGEFRASELAADLGIGLPACNNRLKPLLAAGLLTREPAIARSGGREFVYRVPVSIRSRQAGVA
jgi:hypothetical protein